MIKCRPPGNRRPRRREIDACKPYLKAQMDVHNPRVVCLMGNVAAKAVLGRQGIMTLRGKVLLDRFLVTYHPAAVLRNRNLMEQFVSDLRSALGFK